jgi:transcriptional regulator with XRE-family HTH domain
MASRHTQAIRDEYGRLLDQVVAGLADRNLSQVAKNLGLHQNTVRLIASGKNKNPTLETLEQLADYLFGVK